VGRRQMRAVITRPWRRRTGTRANRASWETMSGSRRTACWKRRRWRSTPCHPARRATRFKTKCWPTAPTQSTCACWPLPEASASPKKKRTRRTPTSCPRRRKTARALQVFTMKSPETVFRFPMPSYPRSSLTTRAEAPRELAFPKPLLETVRAEGHAQMRREPASNPQTKCTSKCAPNAGGATRRRRARHPWYACCPFLISAGCSRFQAARQASPKTNAFSSRSVSLTFPLACTVCARARAGASAGPSTRKLITLFYGQGQMREYLQLSLQQYVMNCCSPDKDSPQKTEDISQLHAGLAEMYQHWEVSKEYGLMQAKALQYLTQFRVGRAPGGESAVQVVEEPRFTFFDVPGIALVPSLLETVSEQCASAPPVPEAAAGAGAASGHDSGSAAQSAAAAQRAYEKSKRILEMFRPHFDESLAAPPPSESEGRAAEAAAGGVSSQFTKAEDALLLNGLKRFGCDSRSWERIRAHVLPTKRASDIKSRYQKLISRHADHNEVKAWKLSLAVSAAGLSVEESDLLQKGVQYFGTRFDLIAEKVLTKRTEAELKQAYDKLISKHTRAGHRPSQHDASAAEGVGGAGATSSRDSQSKTLLPRGKRHAAPKKKGFHSDLLADGSPSASKRRRLNAAGRASGSLITLATGEDSVEEAAGEEDEDFENEVCTLVTILRFLLVPVAVCDTLVTMLSTSTRCGM